METDGVTVPRVLGISEKGKPVTLDECFYHKRSFNFPGLAISRIHVNLALLGCHFEKDEAICFDEIACYSDAVNDWLGLAPIEATLTRSPSYAATISFSPPPPHEWTLSNGITMKVKSLWSAPSGQKQREAQITQKTWVGFEFDKETPLEGLITIASRFNNLVSFVVDQMISPSAIEVYSKSMVEDIGEKKRKVAVQLFYSPDVRTTPNLSKVVPPFPLFSFQHVSQRFDNLVSTWLTNYEQFDSSFNLYFSTKTGRNLYLGNRFLMLVQALESFHRHSSIVTSFPEKDYAALCSLLREAIPDKFKEWLASRLAYGNEPSLRQRLKLLFNGFEPIYGNSKKIKDMISLIVDTRNYRTHYDAKLRQCAAQGKDLYKLCLALETLFQLQMAVLCGLSKNEVIDLCAQSQLFIRKTKEI